MTTKEHKILLLVDTPLDAETIERALRNGGCVFVSKRVATQSEFLQALVDFAPHIILSDYNLQLFNGMSALALIREKYPHIPFIFVANPVGDELAVQAIKHGATDYLLKGNLSAVSVAVEDALKNMASIVNEREVERSMTDFITLVSHQLRTPLSGTRWLIETLQRGVAGPVTDKQKEYLEQIEQANERMLKLVAGILNARSNESSATRPQMTTISINDIFEKVFLRMGFVAQENGIEVVTDYKAKNTLLIESDEDMVASILETFVDNAINYSKRGQNIVMDTAEDGEHVICIVKDSGAGIPKDEHDRIFERFYRTSNAKKLKPEGTGLALYVATLLAKKIGGKITFESSEQGGATFYLFIPKKCLSQKLNEY